jgi:uncharacterized protein YecT (DUF1311 family)
MALLAGLLIGLLPGCTIHHMADYVPGATPPETESGAAASTNCFEASTPAEQLSCATPSLVAPTLALTQTLQARLRDADAFSRDTIIAAQRAWLLTLTTTCHLPDTAAAAPPGAVDCLAQQYQSQTTTLAAWRPPPSRPEARNGIAQYVRFRVAQGAHALNPDFCQSLARNLNSAVAATGSADPASIPGASEIAGTHGPASGSYGGRLVAVTLRDANAYGGFHQRAGGVTLNGAPALTSVTLGALLQSTAANQGARFSAYASQTGDYGAADVFTYDNRLIALLADTWGFDSPAAPGEFAHAGAWDLASSPPAPLCLFDTFQMPADNGVFDNLPNFTPWREVLNQVRDSAQLPLGTGFLRDQSQLRAETNFLLLNMPLVVTDQARAGGWTPWLRRRHDDVLDALFAWSTSDPAHKPVFDKMFALLRPAAADLVRAYQQTQALSGDEAKEAAGLAIMELMYGSTVNIAPGLGADLQAPGDAAGSKPRYPILASPS